MSRLFVLFLVMMCFISLNFVLFVVFLITTYSVYCDPYKVRLNLQKYHTLTKKNKFSVKWYINSGEREKNSLRNLLIY